jgi:zinc transport system substrate-binding protein
MVKTKNVTAWALTLLFAIGLSACSDQSESGRTGAAGDVPDGVLSVYTVNSPLQYFAQRIGGNQVRVNLPVPADIDPAFWEPSADQIIAYQQAHLILLNGASYAKWVRRASLPESRLVDTSAGFADRYLSLEEQVTHSHGTGGEHQHGELAFTTWLDPQQAIQQTAAIRDALIRLRPDAKAAFRQGFASLQKDLLELDGQLAAAFAEYKAQPLLFSHPVYQYLIRRYAIDGYELHWEPDSMPSAAEWRAFDELLKRHPARSMVWEGTPTPEIVIALEQRGIETLVFDPAANEPSDGDYLNVMRDNLVRLLRGPR